MSFAEFGWIYAKRYKMSSLVWVTVICTYFICWCQVVTCVVPEEPVKCSNGNSDCTVTNSYGSFPDRSSCPASDIVYPENEEQLISYVRDATKIKRKIKVVTRFGHSIPKLVCPDGEDGLVVSTKNLNKALKVDHVEQTITVQTGMTLKQLIDEAATAGLALPNSPYFYGITVGGMIATGAHGSSSWGLGGAPHDYIVGLTIVSPGDSGDNYVKVRRLGSGDEDLQAAKVSLGVLGVVSQVTFKLEPLFKRRVTFTKTNDNDLEDRALSFGNEHEFADMLWFPGQREVVYRVDDRVPVSTPGNGVYDYTFFLSTPKSDIVSARVTGELIESLGLDTLRCTNSNTYNTNQFASAYGLKNNDLMFTGYPVIGYQNKIQAYGGCVNDNTTLGYCVWDPRAEGSLIYNDAYTIPLKNVKGFIQDIKKLINEYPSAFCGIDMYHGFLMRYIKSSPAYLGKVEDGIDFDFGFYRSRDPLGPRLFGDIIDEIEQLAVFKYNGVPHWGKNRNVAFKDVIKKFKDGHKFLKVKEKYDPLGLFSNEWTDQILGLNGNVTIKRVGCGRVGLCICADDTDCGPGYGCQEGRVYKLARVCRKTIELGAIERGKAWM